MRTLAQASRVATTTGGVHLANPETGKLTKRVNLGPDFEVAWPDDPERQSLIRSHFGARRFAYNWALSCIICDIDAHRDDPEHESVAWNLAGLRKEWNWEKDETAPWWRRNSKECYSSGIADLAQALSNWKNSKSGVRKGARVGFPQHRSKHRDQRRVRFATGTMRFGDDRRTITVPVIGDLVAKENTRRVQRHIVQGRAQIISMTLSERWGRLFISVNYAVRATSERVHPHHERWAGVDLGMRTPRDRGRL